MSERKYFHEVMGVMFGLFLLNAWYLSSVAVENGILPKSYDYLIRFITLALGSFVGALSAYSLNSSKESKQREKDNILALNKALFVITCQINAVEVIYKEFAKYTSEYERAFNLPAMKPPSYSELKQDIDGLSFLIEFDKPQMLLDLTIEQERFEQAIDSINIRNRMYVEEFQPVLEKHKLNGIKVPIEVYEEKLGERLFKGSIAGAETMYDHIEPLRSSLHKCYESLAEIAREIYPGRKFVRWTAA